MTTLKEVFEALKPFKSALVGAMAANQYMPSRETVNVDFAILVSDAKKAEAYLKELGWTPRGRLVLNELDGTTWLTEKDQEVDLLYLPLSWGGKSLEFASRNLFAGVPTMPLPYLVLMKLIAGRGKDTGDIEELLINKGGKVVQRVKETVDKFGRKEDRDDLDQIIDLFMWRTKGFGISEK